MHSLSQSLAIPEAPRQPAPVELSLIDLVLAATESSEDEFEVNDGIAEMIASGAVKILPREHDPMMVGVALEASEQAA